MKLKFTFLLCLMLALGSMSAGAQLLPQSSEQRVQMPFGFAPAEAINNFELTQSNAPRRAISGLQTPEKILTLEEAQKFTYTWYENGTSGTQHTNNIAETATNPHQIIALLKKIYCDGNIPGPLCSAYNAPNRSSYDGPNLSSDMENKGTSDEPHYYVKESVQSTRVREVYYGAVGGGWNISADEVTAPSVDNEGYTVVIVALKDTLQRNYGNWPNHFTTYTELANYIEANVDSVVLLTDGMRVGSGKNRGTMFNYSGKLNQFFFLSKGQSRDDSVGKAEYKAWCEKYSNYTTYDEYYGELVPFDDLFEQFSPNTGSASSTDYTDFYDKLKDGEIYPILHDCYSVIEYYHQFPLADSISSVHTFSGLNLFVPDYRLEENGAYGYDAEETGSKYSYDYRFVDIDVNYHYFNQVYTWTDYRHMSTWYESTNTVYYYNGTWYNEYTVTSAAKYYGESYTIYHSYWLDPSHQFAADYVFYNAYHQPKMSLYDVTLTATRAEEINDDGTYTVDLEWESTLDKIVGEDIPQHYYVYTIDEDGNYVLLDEVNLNPTTATTYTYTVPQQESSYTITYIVSAQPYDPDTKEDIFKKAWSNTATVVIPGTDKSEGLELQLVRYESDFVSDEPANYYRNYMTLNNGIAYKLTVGSITDGDVINIYRYDGDDMENGTLFATVTLTKSGTSSAKINYTIAYQNQAVLNNTAYPTQSGSLTANTTQASTYELNFNNVMLCDQFKASTAKNDHPNKYRYRAYLTLQDDFNGNGNEVHSYIIAVPVFKTASYLDDRYTQEEVDANTKYDDESFIPAVYNVNVGTMLVNNSDIQWIFVERGENSNPLIKYLQDQIAWYERGGDGSYGDLIGTSGGSFGDGESTKWANALDEETYTEAFCSYVPVIWTNQKKRTLQNDWTIYQKYNTYGADIKTTAVGEVTIQNVTLTKPAETDWLEYWTADGDKYTTISLITNVAAQVPTLSNIDDWDNYEPYMYRVWVKNDGNLRNFTTNSNGQRVDAGAVEDNYLLLGTFPVANMAEGTNPLKPTLGCEFTRDADGNVPDEYMVFGGKANDNFTIVVRFYYKKKENTTEDATYRAPMLRADDGNGRSGRLYNAADNSFSQGPVTAVNELTVGNQVVNTTYYNAQGMQSSTPFDGVNIVVTRYSDGTTRTVKVVK